jgi:aminocarboxymuconate-semialdehyde decarboxylase
MHNIDLNLEEIERAIETLGASGIQIFTNVHGGPIDDPSLDPLFAVMEKYDLPIWLHPARTAAITDYKTEPQSRFEMWWCFGWPYETAVAVSRLILSGLFDRHPRLKLITHHMGGMIPYFDKRIEGGMAVLGTRTPNEDYSQILPSLKRPFMDYYHMIYADTALLGASRGLVCRMAFFGLERVAFGTDAPMGPIAATRDGIAHLNLEKSQLEAVLHGNAEKLINRPIK